MNTPVKSILTALVCVAALFIPSYIAIANYVTAQNAPVDEKSVSKLEITDMAGNLFTLSSDDTAGAKAIADFVSVNGRAAEQTSLPEPLVGTDYFEFKYYSYDRVSTYKYYYSTNPSEAYFVDSNNTAYRITEDDAVSFLSTTYARCLYNTTSFPVMTISGETVAPVEGEWAYKTYGGEYVALDDIPLGQLTEKVYRMKGAFALSFDDEPDFLTVTISDGGTVIYSDLYANIANASLEGKTIDVVVEAKWYETEEQSCSGSAVYKFKAKILLPAVFYLGKTEIEPGEFVVITAKNVDDPSAVTFASEPDIGFTPTFFADGDVVRALVPVSYDFTGSEVKFTCSYGEVSQDMILDITPKTFRSVTLSINATITAQTRTATTMKAYDDAMAPVIAETSSTPLWEGTFIEGVDGVGKTAYLNCGFGLHRTISATGDVYRHEGVDYVLASGSNVMAVNNGTVAYTGYLDYTGYTVVIDHGLGLKSYYYHMSSTAVKVGDTVTKGDVIGYVGATGFAEQSKVHIGLAVYDVPVCPYDLWDEGIIMK